MLPLVEEKKEVGTTKATEARIVLSSQEGLRASVPSSQPSSPLVQSSRQQQQLLRGERSQKS